jgi:hypothetical protein
MRDLGIRHHGSRIHGCVVLKNQGFMASLRTRATTDKQVTRNMTGIRKILKVWVPDDVTVVYRIAESCEYVWTPLASRTMQMRSKFAQLWHQIGVNRQWGNCCLMWLGSQRSEGWYGKASGARGGPSHCGSFWWRPKFQPSRSRRVQFPTVTPSQDGLRGYRSASVQAIPRGWGTTLRARRSRVRFPMRSMGFFIGLVFRPHYGPGVDSASNRNEYQEYFRCVGLNLTTFMCRLSINLWASTSWNPKGLSRPVMGLLYRFYSFNLTK